MQSIPSSNSLHTFREQVCLVQFSTPQADFLLDTMAVHDLEALRPVFASPDIEKVFHAAEYDVLCLKRDFGLQFENLFDTMVAARILGRDEVGLGSMLEAEFGITLDKRFQRANWGRRPIPAELLDYAQHDTHHLIALRERLKRELQAKGLWALAWEDFQRLRLVNGHSEEKSYEPWHIRGAQDLTPQQAAVLHELCGYRERSAERANLPRFKVIGDQTLLQIAIHCPGTLADLGHVDGMSAARWSGTVCRC